MDIPEMIVWVSCAAFLFAVVFFFFVIAAGAVLQFVETPNTSSALLAFSSGYVLTFMLDYFLKLGIFGSFTEKGFALSASDCTSAVIMLAVTLILFGKDT